MKRITKIIAVILAVCMLLPLASCGKAEKPEKQVVENVYKVTSTPVPEGLQYVNKMYPFEDGYLIYGDMNNEEKGWYSSFMKLDKDFNIIEELQIDYGEMPEGERYPNNVAISHDGTIWATVNVGYYDEKADYYENNNYVAHFDADFKLLKYYDIYDFLDIDKENNEYIYISNLIVDSKGNLAFLCDDSFYYVDAEGNILFKKNRDDIQASYFGSLVKSPKGIVVFYNDIDYNQAGAVFNTDTLSFGEPLEIATDYGRFYPGSGNYDFYYSDDKSLFGYEINTGTYEEVMNFLNSDIMDFYVDGLICYDDGTFVGATWDNTSDYSKMVFNKYTPVLDSEVKPKYILTLGGIYTDYRIRQQIFKFNRENEDYRIVIKDYSEGIDYGENSEYTYEDAIAKLNGEIATGNVPDLFICSAKLPFDSYVSKGLFEDIYKYIDGDEELDRSMFEANVLKAYETRGKLCRIAPTYSVVTFAAKPEVLGNAINNWDMNAFMQIANNLPDGTEMFQDITRDNMLSMFCSHMYGEFINAETGKCSFDDGRFEQILEYVSTLSTKSIWETINWDEVGDDFWTDYENAFAEDRVVLSQAYLSSFSSIVSYINYNYKTSEFEFVGFPTGRDSAVISESGQSIAISSKSKFKEGAWEFVKMLLSEEYQDNLSYGFPIRTSSLERMMTKELETAEKERKDWEESNSGIIGGGFDDGIAVMPRKEIMAVDSVLQMPDQMVFLNEALANKVLECIRSADMVMKLDSEVNSIITEEANRFFEGQYSAHDAAMAIQSRVSIYIGENS